MYNHGIMVENNKKLFILLQLVQLKKKKVPVRIQVVEKILLTTSDVEHHYTGKRLSPNVWPALFLYCIKIWETDSRMIIKFQHQYLITAKLQQLYFVHDALSTFCSSPLIFGIL